MLTTCVAPLQAMVLGLNQQRNNAALGWRAGAPIGADGLDPDESMGASNNFCGTPRLVLGPDGQQLALARKLKQQIPETDTRSGEVRDVCSGMHIKSRLYFVGACEKLLVIFSMAGLCTAASCDVMHMSDMCYECCHECLGLSHGTMQCRFML